MRYAAILAILILATGLPADAQTDVMYDLPTEPFVLPPYLQQPPEYTNQAQAPPDVAGQIIPTADSIPLPDELPPPSEAEYGLENDVLYEVDSEPWYHVHNYWGPGIKTSSSFEFGINGSAGNAEAMSYRVGADHKRETEQYKMDFSLKYSRTEADSIETQNYGQFDSKYEHLFGESPWTLFFKSYVLYDEFTAFDVRVALNGGLGYQFISTDSTNLTGRFGSGASREIGGPDDDWKPEAVLGLEFDHQLTKRQEIGLKSEYFPQWDRFQDFRVVSEASWALLLDEEGNLSLKLGVIDLYDSTPNGAKRNDINYSLLLLWKI